MPPSTRSQAGAVTVTRAHYAPNSDPRAKPARSKSFWSDAVEGQILKGAEHLLKRVTFRQLSVGAVMAETHLSRSSFYEHFHDLHDLIARLTEKHVQELTAMIDEGGSELGVLDANVLRIMLEKTCKLYRRRRHLHRALVDAAPEDPALEALRRKFLDARTRIAAKAIRKAQQLERVKPLNPDEAARALILMCEHYICEKLVVGDGASPAEVAETLATLTARAIFGEVN